MLSKEHFQQAINTTVTLHLQNKDYQSFIEETVHKITNNHLIKKGEKYSSLNFFRQTMQHSEYHHQTAKKLLEQDQFQPAVFHTVKSFSALNLYYNLRDLENQATILYVSPVELNPDINPWISNPNWVINNKNRVTTQIDLVKHKINRLISPLINHPIEAYSNTILLPYENQIIATDSDYAPNHATGKLKGISECIANIGLEDTKYLNKPLRSYPNNAYKQYFLCLELDSSEGVLQNKLPKGVSKDLGFGTTYIPIVNLNQEWNGLNYGQRI